jgi:adenosylcobinamide hydrolase
MTAEKICLKDIDWEIRGDTLIVVSNRILTVLSTSVLGGGYSQTRCIINHHVEKPFCHNSPGQYLKDVIRRPGFDPEATVGLMTAADLDNLAVKNEGSGDHQVCAVVTGGISNAASAGETAAALDSGAGTINIILLIGGVLKKSAMAGAIITTTEAKTAALLELGVKSQGGDLPATGTTTDAVVVAATAEGREYEFSGTGTVLGGLIGRAVKAAVIEAVKKQEGLL